MRRRQDFIAASPKVFQPKPINVYSKKKIRSQFLLFILFSSYVYFDHFYFNEFHRIVLLYAMYYISLSLYITRFTNNNK